MMAPCLRPRPKSISIGLLPILASTLVACADGDLSTPTPPATHPNFITNGAPTGASFGNVGALLFDFSGNGTIEGDEVDCSGGLIAPTVFLTAAHCVAFFASDAQLYVSFDPALLPGPPAVIAAEAFHFDPGFALHAHSLPDNDLGVVILPAGSTTGITPLQLPPAGFLDGLEANGGLRDQLFINVGYGLDASLRGRPEFGFDGIRKTSKSPFQWLKPEWLYLQGNGNATGEGGICFGDSGSPHFLDGNPGMAVATTTGVANPLCRSLDAHFRLDTPTARAFLGQYVTLP
jgi:hypothetical protein